MLFILIRLVDKKIQSKGR